MKPAPHLRSLACVLAALVCVAAIGLGGCRVRGGRASLAAYSLKQLGYTEVYAITAPFDEIKKVFG